MKAAHALQYGIPDSIVTDNRPQFASAELESICKDLDVYIQGILALPSTIKWNSRKCNENGEMPFTIKCLESRQSEF